MPAQVDWRSELFGLLGRLSDSWQFPGDALKQSVSELVGKWIGGDASEFADALSEVLQGGSVTEAEIGGVLLLVAKSYAPGCPLGKPFAESLIADLSDGKLESGEIAELAAAWVASRTRDPNLQALLQAAADGRLSGSEIQTAVHQWLTDQGETQLAAALETALTGSALPTMRTLVLFLGAYLLQRQGIASVGTTVEEQRRAIVEALGEVVDPGLVDFLRAVVERRYADAARLALATLGIAADEAAIRALLVENLEPRFRQQLTGKLKGVVEGITDEQAAALAEEVIRLLKGEDKLIAAQAEQEALGLGDWEYGIWQRTRQVLYAAKLAAEGGAVVPTDPMARPHVFAAAAIGADTVVKTLVGESLWGYLLEYIDLFSRAEFGSSIRVAPIGREGMVEEEKTAFSVHLHIAAQLTCDDRRP
jgi:hypothetical protein